MPFSRPLLVLTLIYIALNLALIWAVDPGTSLVHGGDATSYHVPALALLEHGAFVTLDDPSQPDVYRSPVYPLVLAAAMGLFGTEQTWPVVLVQIALLFVSGLIFRATVERWMPGWGLAGMAQLVFNQNLVATAHLVQSDTVFLFFMAVATYAVLEFAAGRRDWAMPLLCGAALALGCLARPSTQFLPLVLPIALPLLAILSGAAREAGAAALKGAVALLLVAAILAPWMLYVASTSNGYNISNNQSRYRFIWDQITMLEARRTGLSYHEATDALTAPGSTHAEFIAAQGDNWDSMSETERFDALIGLGYEKLVSYEPWNYATTMARSLAQFAVSGGAGNWLALLDIDAERINELWFKTGQHGLGPMLEKYLFGGSGASLVPIALCVGFAIAMRLFGLAGAVSLIRERNWALLVALAAIVGYFALIHLFHGNSRYRIGAEPALTLLALYGLAWLGTLRLFRRLLGLGRFDRQDAS